MSVDNSGNKDPWSGKNKNQGPPDLDKVLKELTKKLSGLFSFGKKPSNPQSNSNNTVKTEPSNPWLIVLLILAAIVIIWFLSGIYIVQPAEQAVVLRFGRYAETQGPGLHWIPRFVDSKTVVNIQQINTFGYQAEMLTQDENIVSVEIIVQYQVNDPYRFLYSVVDPVSTLQQATASALRQVVGNMTLDTVLTTGRETLSDQVNQQLNAILAIYQPGIRIIAVTLQSTKPPEEVTAAFNDAIRAREDEVRYQNQADAYASKVVPIAEGQVKRILAEAQAYEQQVVLHAQADVATFNALLPQYQLTPAVMRERMYLATLEAVLQNSSKVLIDTGKNGHNFIYLPLGKLLDPSSMPKATTDDGNYDQEQVSAAASTITTAPETMLPSSSGVPTSPSGYMANGYNFNNNQGGQ